jgi:hypothetical protein
MGAGTNPVTWPNLTLTSTVINDFYQGVLSLEDFALNMASYGMLYDQANDRLWTSASVNYAPTNYSGPWLVSIDGASTGSPTINSPVLPTNATMQGNGGGLVWLPGAFATDHLSGKTLGLASGCYLSGDGSLAGPSLTAIASDKSSVSGTICLRYTAFSGPENQREHRAGDYDLTPESAVVPPDELIDWGYPPVDGVGTMFASNIRGNPAWIQNDILDGLCFIVRRGTGDIWYKKFGFGQTENFAFAWKDAFYAYDPADLASVASGSVNPYDIHATYTDFDLPSTFNPIYPTGGAPRAMQYDPTSNLLYMLHQSVVGEFDPQNVIAVYSVNNG